MRANLFTSKMTKILKCNSCNIVISEILSFIDNKISVMDNETLIRLCRTSFSSPEIEEAKSLLFESVRTDKRKISRRRDGKVERDLQDIITVFKETDPDNIPIFVARDLHKLPPVTFDHIDATRLLKDILVLKEDVTKLKTDCATKADLNKILICHEQNSSPQNAYPQPDDPSMEQEYRPININFKRGAYLDSYKIESGPIGIVGVDMSAVDKDERTLLTENKLTSTPVQIGKENKNSCSIGQQQSVPSRRPLSRSADSLRGIGTGADSPSRAPAAPTGSDQYPSIEWPSRIDLHAPAHSPTVYRDAFPQHQIKTPNHKTFAEMVIDGKESKPENGDQGWIEVQRNNRMKSIFVGKTGKAQSEMGKFRAADTKIPVHVYNVDKAVTDADIKDYIYGKTGQHVPLYKLQMKKDKGYNSFKIFVDKAKLNLFLDDKMWPCGVKFRQFINFREKVNNKNS